MDTQLRIVLFSSLVLAFASISLLAESGAHAHIEAFATQAGRVHAPTWGSHGPPFLLVSGMTTANSDAGLHSARELPGALVSEDGPHVRSAPRVLNGSDASLAILAPPKPSASAMIVAALLGMGILRMAQRLRWMP